MKLYVGNLPFKVGREELENLFSSYGDIEDVAVISDKFSGRSKGFGFVTFKNDADAQKALSEMNGKEIEGRELKVSEAKPMEERPQGERRSFGGGRSGGHGGGFGGGHGRRF